MGGVSSTPKGDARPEEHGDYLLGVLVGTRAMDVYSRLWERLLSLPLTLYWSDTLINGACESMVQNGTSTGHLSKLLVHLAWSLQEVSSSGPDSQSSSTKVTNAVRFSSVFLKYAIEHLANDELEACLSLYLNDKEAEFSGLSKGNQNVASFVVSAILSFIGNSDINSSTYLLHLEIGNLLLVMMSTQLYSGSSSRSSTVDIFLDAAMSQEPALISLVVQKLLLSYIAKPPLPADAAHNFNLSRPNQPRVLQIVGSAAATILRLPYYTYNYLVSSKSNAASSPLAENSLLVLLVLVHHSKFLQFEDTLTAELIIKGEDTSRITNYFCQALCFARDTEFIRADADTATAEESLKTSIPFRALYDALGLSLMDESSILLLYTLMHGNGAFLEYVLVRTDLDTLLMPLLEMLYDAPGKSIEQTYMLVIVLLILSQDSSFNSTVHKLVLPGVPWFKERILSQTTLGSLMMIILIRTMKYNMASLRDVYLHTNCLAALSNMAPHAHKINAYAAQRLVSLFDMLSRKYSKLTSASCASKPSHPEVNTTEDPNVNSEEKACSVDDVPTELHIYTDFLRIVLEIINAILTYALPHNPEVLYALLHRQELFEPFRDHPRFSELVENISAVLSFFNSRLDTRSTEGEWNVETVLQAIVVISRTWRGEGIKVFPQLGFTYEEVQCREEFFVPYVWQLVVCHSGIAWNKAAIRLFHPKAKAEQAGGKEDSGVQTFEMPYTPRVEV